MLTTLEKYYEDGLLHKQTHPTFDLTIWNYTPKVQYERLWDDITMQCRGLVTNSEGDIVARPFKKFFNYEEHKPEDIPNEDFVVYEKLDGSLGILFYYEEELTFNQRVNLAIDEFNLQCLLDYGHDFNQDDIKLEILDKHNVPTKTGEWILATRGSFTSPQAIKGKEILKKYPLEKLDKNNTYLFEIIY